MKGKLEKKQKLIDTLTGAMRTRAARRQREAAAIEKANKTANILVEEGKTLKQSQTAAIRKAGETANKLMEIGENLKQAPQKKRTRPAKIQI
jgi:hypothetical protein